MRKTMIYLMTVLQTRNPICGMSIERVGKDLAAINDVMIVEVV